MTSSPVATTTRLNPLALTGFIVSLVGVLLIITTWPGALVSLVGLVLSVVGRRQTAIRAERGRGFALAGIILGAVGVVLAIGYLVFVFAVLGPQLAQLQQSR